MYKKSGSGPKETILKRRGYPRTSPEGHLILVEKYEPPSSDNPMEIKEWVTWVEDRKGNRFWGHYFYDKSEAEDDFDSRN